MKKGCFLLHHRIGFSKFLGAGMVVILLFSGSIWSRQYPLLGQVMFILGWILSGIGAVGRIWCSIYIAGYKEDVLVCTGPYSMCRNPLYFFSLTGALGVGLASETLLVPALILIFFLLYYPSVVKIEEQRLHRRHLSSFQTYLTRVPAFIPRPRKLIEPESYSINPRVVKHSMMDAIWFIWLCGLVSLANKLHMTGILPEWILLF